MLPTETAFTNLFIAAGHDVNKWPSDYKQRLLTTLSACTKPEGGAITSLPSIANCFSNTNISGCKVSVNKATRIDGYEFDAPNICFTPPSNPGNKRSYYVVPSKEKGIELVAGRNIKEYVANLGKRVRSDDDGDDVDPLPSAKRSASSSAGAAAQVLTPMTTRQGGDVARGADALLALADAGASTDQRAGKHAGTPPASQRARHSKQVHPAPPQPETMDIEMLAQLRAQVEAKVRAQMEEELEKKDNEMTKLRKELAGKDAEMAKLRKKLAAVRAIVVD